MSDAISRVKGASAEAQDPTTQSPPKWHWFPSGQLLKLKPQSLQSHASFAERAGHAAEQRPCRHREQTSYEARCKTRALNPEANARAAHIRVAVSAKHTRPPRSQVASNTYAVLEAPAAATPLDVAPDKSRRYSVPPPVPVLLLASSGGVLVEDERNRTVISNRAHRLYDLGRPCRGWTAGSSRS